MSVIEGGYFEGSGRGRYRIVETMETTRSSVWYRAFDEVAGRTVALKVPGSSLTSVPETRERYFRALVKASRCLHPNILATYEIAESFSVHEYLSSRTLDALIRAQGLLSAEQTVRLALCACRGLDHAHDSGLVHGDFTPSNVLLDETDSDVRVREFGTSRIDFESCGVTRPGELLGGLYYIAPEQIRGDRLDRRIDIYALGIILYEMSTGEVPFRADNAGQLLQMHLTASPRPPRELNPEIPGFLNDVIVRCLEKDPAHRFQTVAEAIQALQPTLAAVPTVDPPADTRKLDLQAENLYRQGAYALAIADWETSLAHNPRSSSVNNNLGCALVQNGRLADALDAFDRAIVIEPENSLAHFNAGTVSYRMQQFSRAAEEYRVTTILSQGFIQAWLWLGRSHLAQQRAEAARQALEKALEHEPENPDVIYQLGNASFLLDRHDEATELWRRARELDAGVADRKNLPANLLLQTTDSEEHRH